MVPQPQHFHYIAFAISVARFTHIEHLARLGEGFGESVTILNDDRIHSDSWRKIRPTPASCPAIQRRHQVRGRGSAAWWRGRPRKHYLIYYSTIVQYDDDSNWLYLILNAHKIPCKNKEKLAPMNLIMNTYVFQLRRSPRADRRREDDLLERVGGQELNYYVDAFCISFLLQNS